MTTNIFRRNRPPVKPQPDDAMIAKIATAIVACANSLDVPLDLLPSMLDTAVDRVPRDFPYERDALIYRLMLNVFDLFAFDTDDYDYLLDLIS